jgi:hypothetical protein
MAMRPILSAVFAACIIGHPTLHAGQSSPPPAPDQLVGTWQLVLAKSSYRPGPAPISETRSYNRGPNGVEGTIQRRFPDGRSERIEYVAEFDREYPVQGTDLYDHILLKRIDARTAEAVLSHAGNIYGVTRREIAVDGKSMTITFKRQTDQGITVMNVAVYERIAP